jgi:hypothetical protein
VYLLFRRENPYKKQCINDKILKDEDLQGVVAISVIDTYINHLVPDGNISDHDIARYRNLIGEILASQKQLYACRLSLAESGFNQATLDTVGVIPCVEVLILSYLTCPLLKYLKTATCPVSATPSLKC